MKVMMPLVGDILSEHFGRAQRFVIYEIENGVVKDKKFYDAIEHFEGAFPSWAKSQGVNLVILCGVGPRAIEFFNSFGIDVISGVAPQEHTKVIQDYLEGTLIYTNKSVCEH
ncbi:NifB/NifX family molybdenum-iron cluster-binding protein [Desulfurella sp.]|uniref:NifB/NifX family molybdenum-iron cluster-binding protein n=1 Tax=Desulfurella sp. TaxID=1962857 RepID=UPI0025C0CEA3|nr:NifB/NifX family molybdenum-iron cluster-binding protein [Desulfurella sp.]